MTRILLAVVAILSFESGMLLSQTEAERDWANLHFAQVLDTVMPLQRTASIYIVYRAHRDLHTEVPEYWFLIGTDPNEKGYGLHPYLSAHIRAADTSSIYDQLVRMHRSDAKEDASSIAKKVRLKAWDWNEANCPAITDELEKLKDLQSKLPDLTANTIVLHPMNHEFHLQAATGDANLVLWDDEHPLVKWALDTRRALDKCAQAK
jgi:hypothetical protein